jgi:hypothetical protein
METPGPHTVADEHGAGNRGYSVRKGVARESLPNQIALLRRGDEAAIYFKLYHPLFLRNVMPYPSLEFIGKLDEKGEPSFPLGDRLRGTSSFGSFARGVVGG